MADTSHGLKEKSREDNSLTARCSSQPSGGPQDSEESDVKMDLETASAHMRSLVRIWSQDDLSRHYRYNNATSDFRVAKTNIYFEQNMNRMPRDLEIVDLDSVTDVEMSRIGMMIQWEKQATIACYIAIGILRSEIIQLNEIEKISSHVLELDETSGKDENTMEACKIVLWATAELQHLMFELKFLH